MAAVFRDVRDTTTCNPWVRQAVETFMARPLDDRTWVVLIHVGGHVMWRPWASIKMATSRFWDRGRGHFKHHGASNCPPMGVFVAILGLTSVTRLAGSITSNPESVARDYRMTIIGCRESANLTAFELQSKNFIVPGMGLSSFLL